MAAYTLEEFQTKVRETAIRVADEMGWCRDGLNAELVALGLKPVADPIRVPVKLTLAGVGKEVVIRMEVRDADGINDAIDKLRTDPDRTLKYASQTGWGEVKEFEVLEPPTQPTAGSGVPAIGDANPGEGEWWTKSTVSGGPNQCRVTNEYFEGLYCTRPVGHAADWHVAAGQNAGVLAVFPAAEGDTRPDPERIAGWVEAQSVVAADDDDDELDED